MEIIQKLYLLWGFPMAQLVKRSTIRAGAIEFLEEGMWLCSSVFLPRKSPWTELRLVRLTAMGIA